MALTADELAQVKQVMTDVMNAAKAPQGDVPNQGVTTPPKQPSNAPAFDLDTLQEMITNTITNTLQQQTKDKESELGKSLWEERVHELTTRNPAFAEYLEGEDDWGIKRMDRIAAIDNYAERVKAMSQLTSRFSEAQVMAASTNSQPKIPKRVQEQADKTTKQYGDIDAKLERGEITPEEHTRGFFDLFDDEVLSKM